MVQDHIKQKLFNATIVLLYVKPAHRTLLLWSLSGSTIPLPSGGSSSPLSSPFRSPLKPCISTTRIFYPIPPPPTSQRTFLLIGRQLLSLSLLMKWQLPLSSSATTNPLVTLGCLLSFSSTMSTMASMRHWLTCSILRFPWGLQLPGIASPSPPCTKKEQSQILKTTEAYR